jgi:hypothetical protein
MGVILTNFSGKKIMISCSEKNKSKLIFKNYMLREIFGNFITIFFCVNVINAYVNVGNAYIMLNNPINKYIFLFIDVKGGS